MQVQKECTPTCKKFRCDRKPNALQITKQQGKKVLWCTWVEDECDGPYCKFGICLDRRMTDRLMCKPISGGKQTDQEFTDDFEDPGYIPKEYQKKLKK